MTIKQLFNRDWKYIDHFNDSYINPSYRDADFQKVTLPHTNREMPYNCFDEKDYQFVSCYRKHFTLDRAYQGKRIFIDFEGAMTFTKVYINGEAICEHKGGYTPFSEELTDYLVFERENVLTVLVDSTERPDIPPFGMVVDYLCFGGIYRDVYIRICDYAFIQNVMVSTPAPLNETKAIEAKVIFSERLSGEVTVSIKDGDDIVGSQTYPAENAKNATLLLKDLKGIELWDIEHPRLYQAEITLRAGELTDTYTTRIGFRDARLTASGFFLNGKRVKLVGLNRHQSFPYVGYTMPKRVQRRDADILKYELGLNCVRTSHYIQSPHFLDRCDEIGLLVFEEIPGWQHIGDEDWKKIVYQDTQSMIERDYNHPSIFLWGVRINESADDSEFYLKTNAIAHHHDPTRQTGGVRCITNSEMLEDVYTMNDFIYGSENRFLRPQQEVTGLDHDVPYLVTEYAGHMFPTKRFDQEERQSEHTLRHLQIQNASFADDSISGAIGWCAFDYNTHYEFGSGDRVCYHGVCDMFRIPKFAAFAYTSQRDPAKGPVLEPVTLWTMGERNKGGNQDLMVCTNCDYVKLYIGNEFSGTFYPDKEHFPHLPHPPVPVHGIGDTWGEKWRDATFIGCVNDKEVAVKEFAAAPVPASLAAFPDDSVLDADGMDMTRVVYKLVDQVGNIMPFANEVIRFKIKGGEIVGPERTALIGGCIAVWVKAPSKPGKVILKASCSRFKAKKIIIEAK